MKYSISKDDDLLIRLKNQLWFRINNYLWNRLLFRIGFQVLSPFRERLKNRLNRYEV
jgi:hypothetical protein